MGTTNKANDDESAAVPTRISLCCWRKEGLYHAVMSEDEVLGRCGSDIPPSTSSSSGSSAKRSAIASTILVLSLAAMIIFATGYVAGERHGERLGVSIGASNSDLLGRGHDAHDGTVTTGSQNTKTYQKFLVFAEQRSGSRFLTELLDDHPQVRCSNEELNHPGSAINIKHLSLDDYLAELDKAYQRVFQNSKHGSPREEQIKAVGFKVMYNQGVVHYGSDLMEKLDEMNIKVIHLERRNKLLQYISEMSNEKDKQIKAEGKDSDKHIAHPTTPEEAERIRDEITVNGRPSKVLHFMQKKFEGDKEVSDLVSEHLHDYARVIYEQLSDKTEEEMATLFDFLGVDKRNVHSRMEKIHKGKPTRSYFAEKDQEELRVALEESDFAWVLDGWRM